jgi:hypothetical protein
MVISGPLSQVEMPVISCVSIIDRLQLVIHGYVFDPGNEEGSEEVEGGCEEEPGRSI